MSEREEKSSATPRTDALIKGHAESADLRGLAGYYNELLDHARQLERELAEIPLCGAHAGSWFTERNHLKDGMDAKCVVCAHELPSAIECHVEPEDIMLWLIHLDVECNKAPGTLDLEAAHKYLRRKINGPAATAEQRSGSDADGAGAIPSTGVVKAGSTPAGSASSTVARNPLADTLETLGAMATTGPWAWDQRGEKINEWGLGVAFDANEKPLSGRFTDEDAQYIEQVCQTEGATVNYDDPELICALRNNLPEIVAALRGTPSSTTRNYQRAPEYDRRIGNGDDYAGDAFVSWCAVGHEPSDAHSVAAPEPSSASFEQIRDAIVKRMNGHTFGAREAAGWSTCMGLLRRVEASECAITEPSSAARGEPVLPCVYRSGCRSVDECMAEQRCCARDTSSAIERNQP